MEVSNSEGPYFCNVGVRKSAKQNIPKMIQNPILDFIRYKW